MLCALFDDLHLEARHPVSETRGCVGINLETLTNWQIYGPHIYLSIRLAYDPAADADAIMDDYFAEFYGPKAGPAMKQYWLGIDRAFDQLACESGSFFALHLVYTDEFLKECRQRLDQAAAAARGDAGYAARVEMASEGLKNAEQYLALRRALNTGDIPAAQGIYENLLSRSVAHQQTKLGNHYTVGYLERFVGTHVAAAAAATAAPAGWCKCCPTNGGWATTTPTTERLATFTRPTSTIPPGRRSPRFPTRSRPRAFPTATRSSGTAAASTWRTA